MNSDGSGGSRSGSCSSVWALGANPSTGLFALVTTVGDSLVVLLNPKPCLFSNATGLRARARAEDPEGRAWSHSHAEEWAVEPSAMAACASSSLHCTLLLPQPR